MDTHIHTGDYQPSNNFTDKHQFTRSLNLKGTNIEVVDKMKVFGTTEKGIEKFWCL